jgi:ribonuclease HI
MNAKVKQNKVYKLPKTNYAFVDGSFNPTTKEYGYGGYLVDAIGVQHILQGKGNDPEMAKMRNVAGEILGAKAAVDKAQELGLKSLTIFYDYEGIAAWVLGRWQCKNKHTAGYKKYILDSIIKAGMHLSFTHVKGHTGIAGNEEADRLAKLAVGLLKNAS